MKNRTGTVTNISRTFVPRQNESKIRRITFYDHVNMKYKTQEITDGEFYKKILNNDHNTPRYEYISWENQYD